jgi:hypothetical protein
VADGVGYHSALSLSRLSGWYIQLPFTFAYICLSISLSSLIIYDLKTEKEEERMLVVSDCLIRGEEKNEMG